jgi:FkbM family methyltransferase
MGWPAASRLQLTLPADDITIVVTLPLECVALGGWWPEMNLDRLTTLTSELADFPLKCRPGTSDRDVFHQVFVEREYGGLDDVQGVNFIVDCGANVGYSAAYLMSRFPAASLIAIEPDPDSFEVLRLNLAPYGDKAMLYRSAVWSHPARLTLREAPYRDAREWARQVRECRPGEGAGFLAVDIGGLLYASGRQRISILKVDIEGAEAEVFGSNYEHWIGRVDSIAIELHDDSVFGNCSDIFARATAGRGFSISRNGDITVCKKHQPREPGEPG